MPSGKTPEHAGSRPLARRLVANCARRPAKGAPSSLIGRETCVVHGNPSSGNVRITADRVALIDWDESRVDVPDLDLVLPHDAAGLDAGAHDVAAKASAAWEAAVCCKDEHAIKRLAAPNGDAICLELSCS